MLAIFLKTIPFFGLIALGFWAGRRQFFTAEATAYLTRFVFYFALSAMLFGFAANLDLGAIFSLNFVLAYTLASLLIWTLALIVARLRGASAEQAVFEAHCGVIGNVGFLGIPMLALLMGQKAVGPVLMVLAVDLIVFSSILTLAITGLREGRMSLAAIKVLALGILANPMIVSVVAGLAWGATGWALPGPINEFLTLLGAAATPCALFAIGASLAERRLDRPGIALWLTLVKLVLHPLAVAIACLWVFDVPAYPAAVMIAASALPVAGNVFILAQHYRVAPQRISAAILMSTALSVLSVSLVVGLLGGLVLSTGQP